MCKRPRLQLEMLAAANQCMFQPGEAEDQIPKENSDDCSIGGGCEEKMQARLSRRYRMVVSKVPGEGMGQTNV